jgi:hypothetical protein
MDFQHVLKNGPQMASKALQMRCPYCRKEGTLDARGGDIGINVDGNIPTGDVSGERICPNPTCRGLIYVVYTQSTGEIVASYPPELIDFDATNLPPEVSEPLEEAVSCHAQQCYPASAVMSRRTLECICEDQGAKGDNLYDRIESLAKTVVLPDAMIKALHNLRLLGNDAVHVEARVFAEVGKPEAEAAISVAKMIVQAAYQMDTLLSELEALKRPTDSDAQAS